MSLTEGQHAGEFLISMAPGSRSLDKVTVVSGQTLKAGAVLGRTALGIGRASIPTVVGTGNGTMSLVTVGPEAEVGNYVVKLKTVVADGGVFSVTSPSGKVLDDLTLTPGAGGTTAYTGPHINFSITDGSTDFALNDTFTIVVSTTAPTVIGGTGTGTISALSLGPQAIPGNYRVINREAITNGGRFEVIAPNGQSLGDNFLMTAGSGTATAFVTPHIKFTLTDATDFIAGNYFDVAVFNQLSGGKVKAWDPAGVGGEGQVAGVLWDNVDAAAGDKVATMLARDAEVTKGQLQFATGVSAGEKELAYEQLAALGIIPRDSV